MFTSQTVYFTLCALLAGVLGTGLWVAQGGDPTTDLAFAPTVLAGPLR